MLRQLFERLSGSRPKTTFRFHPRWKEELVVRGPEGTFVLEYTMGVATVYLPTQKEWGQKAPEWARVHWPVLKEELETWCAKNKTKFHIDETASVFEET